MSATVSSSNSFSRSRLCTRAAKSRRVLGSLRSRLWANRLIDKMMLDQPGGGLGLGRRQPKARAELAGNAAAGDRMILVAALGDVVDKGRDIKRAAIVDGADDLARYRVLGGELPALDARQEADGADQVLVHREVVIHVELHHRHDAPEIRDEAAEHARLVHLAQHAFGIARVGQELHEQPIGGRVVARACRRSGGNSSGSGAALRAKTRPDARRRRRTGE